MSLEALDLNKIKELKKKTSIAASSNRSLRDFVDSITDKETREQIWTWIESDVPFEPIIDTLDNLVKGLENQIKIKTNAQERDNKESFVRSIRDDVEVDENE